MHTPTLVNAETEAHQSRKHQRRESEGALEAIADHQLAGMINSQEWTVIAWDYNITSFCRTGSVCVKNVEVLVCTMEVASRGASGLECRWRPRGSACQ